MKWTTSLLLIISLAVPLAAVSATDKPIDYQTLDFSLTLATLRAGNHDPSGVNQYYFQTKLFGIPILKEEINKPFTERKKSEVDLGHFAEIKIESLKYWSAEKKPTTTMINIKGDKLRALIAETMRTYSVPEDQTAILVYVYLFAKAKKFGWLGDDLKVGETSFAVIPESLPHGPKLNDETLTIFDKQGTFVEIKLEYRAIELARKAAADALEAQAAAASQVAPKPAIKP